ncbi:MAG: ABC transporter substrate-binding protein [Porticoccaceae bacterium]|jgi:phospholipid transport system substrate-binding protein|nr:ABC transporter substrate-binding protein [Porticoccaceae bacterium]|tara:strand:- start:4589 stop:5227 length:639 start_codon:yes stop_codon:yes gene_type:complete
MDDIMERFKKILGSLWLCLSILGAVHTASAEGMKQNPFDNIEQMTIEVIATIAEHKNQYPSNEAVYFDALDRLMGKYVDFSRIAGRVMGGHRKASSAEQRDRFITLFREGLVETYGRGLMSYGDEKIVLVNRKALDPKKRAIKVSQQIRSATAVYPLEYWVARKKTGEWKVINVVLNGINLESIFRSQFAKAAQKSSGNLDEVIDSWLKSAD